MRFSFDQKLQVYFNEYNVLMDNAIYLPLVSGLLHAYAQTKDIIRENYQFMPIIFIRDYLERILSRYQNPAIAAFSTSMWNMNLSLTVARRVKEKFPNCLIVFGGPHVPFNATDFFQFYPFIDVTVRGEGEQTFADLLIKFLDTRDFRDIPGISYRDPKSGKCIRNDEECQLIKDLDIYPSPYLEGVFDYLLPMDIDFQVIIETNRGCPFMCSFCFWGQGGLNKRYRSFSLNRVKKVVEWCGLNKIKYVFCADSNFGIFKRDLEIAKYFVQIKLKYGFPEKFRVCYSKNVEDTIYEIGKILTKHNMEKGITMSLQSNSQEALFNVGRKNIKSSVYYNLQKKYNKENIPVYTELILGLPGETYQSFLNGIEEILESAIKNQVFVYLCQVYPNTELADKEYQKKFKISTVRIPLNEIHAVERPREFIPEYEDIIVSTASMPVDDWKRTVVVSWIMQLFHGLKLGFYILIYLVDRYHVKYTEFFEYIGLLKIKSNRIKILKSEVLNFYKAADSIIQGNPRGLIMPNFGNIYWEIEEASYINISNKKESFYNEMYEVTKEYLESIGVDYNDEELKEVVEYQKARVSNYMSIEKQEYYFKHNIPEYFDTYFLEARSSLSEIPQIMILTDFKDYKGDKKAFAKEIILYGRKSNKMLHAVRWFNSNTKARKIFGDLYDYK